MTSVAAGANAGAAPATYPRNRRLVFIAVWTLNGAAYGCVWPFVALYAARRGLALADIGVLSALGAATAAALQPVLGRLLDRTRRPRTILAGTTALGALGDLDLARAGAAPLLVLGAALGMAAFYGTRVVLVPVTLAALEQRAQGSALFARYRICSPLGFTATAIGGGLLLGRAPFGLLFSAGAALYVALGLAGLALPPAAPRPGARAAPAAVPPVTLHPRRVLRTLAAMALLYGLATSCSDTYVPLLMRQVHGTYLQVGLAGTVVTVVEVPLMLLFGGLADRGYQAGLLALGMTLLPLRFALYFMVQTPLQLLGVQLLDGPAFAAFAIVGVALLMAQTPPQERAWTLSVYAAAGTAGPVVGPLLAGLAAGRVGIQPMFGLVALGTVVVPMLVIVGLWPLLRPRPATRAATP